MTEGFLKGMKWRGVEETYTLPWIRDRVEVTANRQRIAEYTSHDFTRSRMLMNLLQQFHLSQDSILVSDDDHSGFLRQKLMRAFPRSEAYPAIAQDLADRLFRPRSRSAEPQTVLLSSHCVRELYITMLQSILGVRILPPLRRKIEATNFTPGWRPLRLEAFLYSVGLHSPALAPVHALVNTVFFRDYRAMRKVARQLEKDVINFTVPAPGSWFETLHTLHIDGQLTKKQMQGEITSMLVSAFSLGATLSFSLLCLATLPYYVEKIRNCPDFARHFYSEVLRLYPPFHHFGYQRPDTRFHRGDDKEPSDFLISALYLHRNPEDWEDANCFWPERFEQAGNRARLSYLPFGIGGRICPGRSYSLRLVPEVLKYVCSESAGIELTKQADMPIGTGERVISFPVDDALTYRRSSCP